MPIEHWIFAGAFSHAKNYAMDKGLVQWRYATRENFRGHILNAGHTVHILDSFDDEDLERELMWQWTHPHQFAARIIDLRDPPEFYDIPDLTDPEAVEAWLDA